MHTHLHTDRQVVVPKLQVLYSEKGYRTGRLNTLTYTQTARLQYGPKLQVLYFEKGFRTGRLNTLPPACRPLCTHLLTHRPLACSTKAPCTILRERLEKRTTKYTYLHTDRQAVVPKLQVLYSEKGYRTGRLNTLT